MLNELFLNNLFWFYSLLEPPSIIKKPESMDVLPGTRVQFSVFFSGTTPLTIKWFKENKEILSSSHCSVQKDNCSSLLELFFAKTSDSGDYFCEISNDIGSEVCKASLFVKGSFLLYCIDICMFYMPCKLIEILVC